MPNCPGASALVVSREKAGYERRMSAHSRTSLFTVAPCNQPDRRNWAGRLLLCMLPTLVACTEVVNEAKTPDSYGLTVVGTGRAVAEPDIAIANVGVEVRDANPQRAVELNNKQMSLLVANLKAMGVQDADLQTNNFSISYERPPTDYRADARPRAAGATQAPDSKTASEPNQPSPPEQPIAQGWFVVNNTLRIKVRDLNRLGEVLTAATAAGANSIWGVDLQLDKPEPLLFQARDEAIEDALNKAQRLAQRSGVRLGRIISIEEQGAGSPGPQPAGMLFARDAKSSVPIETGSLELNASVIVRFALDSNDVPPSNASPEQSP